MYSGQNELDGFFLFDAVKAAAKFVVGGIKSVVGGVASQTGSTTPVIQQTPAPVPPPTNYTPYLIGGAALVSVLLLTQRKR